MLVVEHISKRFGGLVAVDDVSLSTSEGCITGLIGPNGAGKTTLFTVIGGFAAPSAGRVMLAGEDITREPAHLRARRGIVRTFQLTQPFAGLTVRENIAVGAHLRHRARGAALAHAEEAARRVGLCAEIEKPAASLTVAARKRLELARALATEPKILLLDEVLAGLNPSEVRAMIPAVRAINQAGIAILMIEHVMQAVMNLCAHIYVMAESRIIAEGPPAEVVRDPRVVAAYLGHGAARHLSHA